ncbi:branched-chain amino acid ABC transporter substrate-binding protein [Roseomonas sp. KE2513]|uniref:amino acid ABC transporter substrate-binding protein n=1 Tax=Roseomonas sp. KE2513 TaxID=2479202 RepID=UPI0018DFE6B4|nr:amino acid ABC transporter substrate-binding protein [Roseomonas sp. KE2513]MBI0538999.1 branched-chain amino acid ABC transporter substrate-binding protein [Roseomonas sp. KE2513]
MDKGVLGRRAVLATSFGATLAAPLVARSQPAGSPVRIGFSIAQTGTLAAGGRPSLLARQLWMHDVNARGGLLGRPVELVFYDDQTSAATSPAIYAKLLDVDRVDLLVGPYGTPVQAPIMPMARQRGKLLFGNFSFRANEEMRYDRYFNIAPFGATPDAWPGAFVRLAHRRGLKRLAIMVADAEGTVTLGAGARETARSLGMEVVYDQRYPFNTTEFSSVLRAVRSARPEAVYVGSFPNETAGIVRSVAEIGVGSSVQLFGGGMVGLQFAPLLESLGDAVNGLVNFQTYVPERTMEFPGIREFIDRYAVAAKAGGVDVLGFYLAPFNYAMGQVLEAAVKAVGSLEDEALSRHMKSAEFETVVGKIAFGPTGEWRDPRMVQVQFQGVRGTDVEQYRQAGRQVIVEPPELVSGELRMPFERARR